MKIFGCPAYFHVNEGKLEPRAKKAVFVGYASGVKGYRLYSLDSKSPKFVVSRDVTFDEASMLKIQKVSVESTIDSESVSKKVELKVEPLKKV